MLQLMREGCSYTYPPLSIARYSFIQLSELEQCRVKKLAQGFNTAARIRTRVLVVESPKLYPWATALDVPAAYTGISSPHKDWWTVTSVDSSGCPLMSPVAPMSITWELLGTDSPFTRLITTYRSIDRASQAWCHRDWTVFMTVQNKWHDHASIVDMTTALQN